MDIICEGEGQPILKLRKLDGVTYFDHEIEEGSFIINCTDHVSPSSMVPEPILSDDGRVCAPQFLAGFSGPSANLCTHLFYHNKLEPIWRKLPRLNGDLKKKPKFALELAMVVILNSEALTRAIPNGRSYVPDPANLMPRHRLIFATVRFLRAYPRLFKKMLKMIPERYTDTDVIVPEDYDLLAGRIGPQYTAKL